MSESKGLSKTHVVKKYWMAFTGLFLLIFLLQHFIINSLSVFSADAFNETSHFMGTNPIIQYVMQPILILGVVMHLITGVIIEQRNRKARPVNYAYNKGGNSSSWMSRNMIITGIMVILFLGLHFYDFWIPEIKTKFIDGDFSGTIGDESNYRYFTELQHKFVSPVRLIIYCLSFVFLALHLMHGFQSAFQSVGLRHNKYTPTVQLLGQLYAIIIPLGFIVIAVFHFINTSH